MPAEKGYVYILTNPSFPDYVKIGYADDVEDRVRRLNKTECTPFAFRIYATLEVPGRLKDIPIHDLIDKANPNLRSIDKVEGKIRKREFYAWSPEDAYEFLGFLAEVWNSRDKLQKWTKTKEEQDDEKTASEVKKLALNRHHFREIEFASSLTGKRYRGARNEEGTLSIYEIDSGEEILAKSNPSSEL